MPINSLAIETQHFLIESIKNNIPITTKTTLQLSESSSQLNQKTISVTDTRKKLANIATTQGRNLQYISILSRKFINQNKIKNWLPEKKDKKKYWSKKKTPTAKTNFFNVSKKT